MNCIGLLPSESPTGSVSEKLLERGHPSHWSGGPPSVGPGHAARRSGTHFKFSTSDKLDRWCRAVTDFNFRVDRAARERPRGGLQVRVKTVHVNPARRSRCAKIMSSIENVAYSGK